MRFLFFLAMIFAALLVGCKGNQNARLIDHSELDTIRNNNGNGNGNYNGSQPEYVDNNPQPEYSGAEEYPPELLEKVREYPVLLAPDPLNEASYKTDQRDILFTTVHNALSGTFSLHNIFQEELALRQELEARGTSATIIPEDFLFEKYANASVCVYLWGKIEERRVANEIGQVYTFLYPEVRCRIVDMITRQELERFNESPGKVDPVTGTPEFNRRNAMKIASEMVAQKLSMRIGRIIPVIVKQTYLITGTLTNAGDLEKMRATLQIMEEESYLRIKRIVSESGANFRYEVICPKKDMSTIASILQETAESESLMIRTRLKKGVIDVTPKGSGGDDFDF